MTSRFSVELPRTEGNANNGRFGTRWHRFGNEGAELRNQVSSGRFGVSTTDWDNGPACEGQTTYAGHNNHPNSQQPQLADRHNGKDHDNGRNPKTRSNRNGGGRNRQYSNNAPSMTENSGRLNGEASERAVLTILSNESYWHGLIQNVRQEKATNAEFSYFDISFELHPVLANLFRMRTIQVQVKTDPSKIEHYITDRIPRYIENGMLQGGNHHPIVEQCLVFLNGGGGRVRREAVVAPLIHQLLILAELRGVVVSENKLQDIIEKANNTIWHDYQIGLNRVVDRDYRDIVYAICMCEENWQTLLREDARDDVEITSGAGGVIDGSDNQAYFWWLSQQARGVYHAVDEGLTRAGKKSQGLKDETHGKRKKKKKSRPKQNRKEKDNRQGLRANGDRRNFQQSIHD